MTSDSQTESGGVVSSTDWLACPWCKDTDFDDVGLKLHITSGHCDAFNNLSVALPVTRKANDLKLSDCEARRGSCAAGGKEGAV